MSDPRSAAESALRAGDPRAALQHLTAAVKAKPADPGLRIFLAQLLCVLGQWERAHTQLNVVADMDADAELYALVLGHLGIAGDHPTLNVDGAAHGVDDAGELGQQPVARRLHQPSVMLGELGIEQGSAMSLQLPDRAFLVGAHQPAIASDIGRQDGREPPVQTLACQGYLRG